MLLMEMKVRNQVLNYGNIAIKITLFSQQYVRLKMVQK